MSTNSVGNDLHSSNSLQSTVERQSFDYYRNKLSLEFCITSEIETHINALKTRDIKQIQLSLPLSNTFFADKDVCDQIFAGMYKAAYAVKSGAAYTAQAAERAYQEALRQANARNISIYDYVALFIKSANSNPILSSKRDPHEIAGFFEARPYMIFQDALRATQNSSMTTTLHPSYNSFMQQEVALILMNRQISSNANENFAVSNASSTEMSKQLTSLQDTIKHFGFMNGNHATFFQLYDQMQQIIDDSAVKLYHAKAPSVEVKAFMADYLFWEPIQKMQAEGKSSQEVLDAMREHLDWLQLGSNAKGDFDVASKMYAERQLRLALPKNDELQGVFYDLKTTLDGSNEDTLRYLAHQLGVDQEVTEKILRKNNAFDEFYIDLNLGECLKGILHEAFRNEIQAHFSAMVSYQYQYPQNRLLFGDDVKNTVEFIQHFMLVKCREVMPPKLPSLNMERIDYRDTAKKLLSAIEKQHKQFNENLQAQGLPALTLNQAQKYQIACTLLERSSVGLVNELNTALGTHFSSLSMPQVLPTTASNSIKHCKKGLYDYEELLTQEFAKSKNICKDKYPELPVNIVSTVVRRIKRAHTQLINERLSKIHAEMMRESHSSTPANQEPRERPISVKIDPVALNVVKKLDFTTGITLQDAKKDHAAAKKIDPKTAEAVQDLVDDIKAQTNEHAVRELFQKMASDSDISLEVYRSFRDNWENSDGGLIGKDYKENKLFITPEHMTMLIAEARRLSKVSQLNAELEKFKVKLLSDMTKGAVTPRHTVIQNRYQSFFSLVKTGFRWLTKTDQEKWQTGYKKVVCDTLLMEEMKKSMQGAKATVGTHIENTVLERLGKGDADSLQVRAERHAAEVKVLKNLMDGQGLMGEALENMERKVSEAKRDGRLEASGLIPTEQKVVKALIEGVEENYYNMLASVQHYKETFSALPANFSAKHKQQMQQWKAKKLEHVIQNHINTKIAALTANARYAHLQTLTPEKVKEEVTKEFAEIMTLITDGSLSKAVEFHMLPNAAFLTKWGQYLVTEMIQGLEDEQECLIDGVCAGVSTRCAVIDQRNPAKTMQELTQMKIVEVKDTDRVTQAFHRIANKFVDWFKSKDQAVAQQATYLDKAYPKGMKHILGIKNVTEIASKVGARGASLSDSQFSVLFQDLDNKSTTLQKSDGVLMMRLVMRDGAHRTYIRKDPSRGQYRVLEPNHGGLVLPSKEQLYECIKDLCKDYALNGNPVNQISFHQLDIVKS